MHIPEQVKTIGVPLLALTGFIILGVKGLVMLDQRIKFSEKVFKGSTPESRENIVAAIGMAAGVATFFALLNLSSYIRFTPMGQPVFAWDAIELAK